VFDESMKYYELLGVAPGASAQELKTAHRDLSKVWHPDRFAHDPRLQQIAQEKLKEINEAYDQLKAGKTGRRRAPDSSTAKQSSAPPAPGARQVSWKFILLPALAFVLIFFAASRALMPTGQQSAPSQAAPSEQTRATLGEEGRQPGGAVRLPAGEATRGKRADQPPTRETTPGGAPGSAQEMRQARPLPTMTLTIDPMSGMLATPACPVKSRMTYPSGAEPRASCNLSHQGGGAAREADPARPKESRLKTFARRLSPAKLFGGKRSSDEGSGSQGDKSNPR
jgi:hypothetical protein